MPQDVTFGLLFDDFDDPFDTNQPDRMAEVARELIVAPPRPAGSRPRVPPAQHS